VICSESQALLVPGYKLLERLGQGGFGEVWKAEAPGGLLKAVKFVYGSLQAGAEHEDVRVRQELKSLERVKTVRHPYILSLERFDLIDGRLVIITELADRSLWDRFKECQAQGLPGIPRDELLRYLEEVAEALDLMNTEYQLQHLDIKPQNIFLLYNHVKVGDFGLVKDLEGMWTQVTSGVTALYAPPETFEGLVSRFCDQYSLAIVYQQMLTGQMPFAGANPRQLMLQHLTGTPNVKLLPPGDRAPVLRALAKKPEDRHPSCSDFVRALRRGDGHGTDGTNGEQALGTAAGVSTPSNVISTPSRPGDKGLRPSGTSTPSRPGDKEVLPPANRTPGGLTPLATSPAANRTPGRLTPRAISPAVPVEKKAVAPPPERPEVTGEGPLFPALVVGLGGMGLQVLQQLRKSLHKRYGPPEVLPHVRLCAIDTDPDVLGEVGKGEAGAVVHEHEVTLARLHRPAHYLKPGRERQELERWLPRGMLSRLPRDQTTTAGRRALGRLALVSNYTAVMGRLRTELEACVAPEAMAAAQRQTGLGLRTNRPRVYVVAGLAGGTGSGMFLDLAYGIRHLLKQLGYPRPDVVGLFLLPAVACGPGPHPGPANAFAALAELSYFAAPGVVFSASYPEQPDALTDPDAPFGRCCLLPLPETANDSGPLRELAARAGDFLCRDLTTPLGRTADEARLQIADRRLQIERRRAGPSSQSAICNLQSAIFSTFGTYWFAVPRRLLLERVAKCLGHRLVQSWRTRDPGTLEGMLKTWVAGQLTGRGLLPEGLGARLQAACGRVLGQAPEAVIDAVLERWARGGASDLGRHPAGVGEALVEMERLAGSAGHEGAETGPSPYLDEALDKAGQALGAEAENQLAEVVLGALTEPQFRLTGMEEAIHRRLSAALAQEAQDQKAEGEKLTRQAQSLGRQIATLAKNLGKGSLLRWGHKARTAADLVELFRGYALTRFQALLHRQLSRLYQGWLSNAHKYVREVNCCRPRLAQFLRSLEDPAAGGHKPVDLGLGRYLLPGGCRTLDEAAGQILGALTREELLDLSQNVQAVIQERLQAQVHVCTAPAPFFRELEEAIYQQVAAFAEAQLTRAHAAEMYVEQHAQDETVLADLTHAFDEALPELAGARASAADEVCILAVPPGPEGEYFRGLVRRALPDQEMVAAASTDDIVFYREQPSLSVSALPQVGPAAQQAYQEVLTGEQGTPHSRGDITDWLSPAS
jgi:serine/threonine protein kinase